MIAGETIAIDGAKSRAHNGKKSNFNQNKIDNHLEYIEAKTQENLILLRVDQDHAYAWSRTRKGGWAVAQSLILNTTITLKRLKQRGYQSLTDVCIERNPSLCEPPNTACPYFYRDDPLGLS